MSGLELRTSDRVVSQYPEGAVRVSDLVRGKWEKFSIEMLITLAARAGSRVEVRIVA